MNIDKNIGKGKSILSDHSYSVKFSDIDFRFKPLNEDLSEEDYILIGDILETMGKEIWLDRSYVETYGNYHGDRFITEETWNIYVNLVDRYIEKKKTKDAKLLQEMNIGFLVIYMYLILDKYNYGFDDVEIFIEPKVKKTYAEFYHDKRTKWEEY